MINGLCYKYDIVRSDRKTAAIQIFDDRVVFRIPKRMTDKELDAFAEKHENWILKQLENQKAEQEKIKDIKPLSKEEIDALRVSALEKIIPRVEHYAAQLNVTYGKITVKHQKTRWGSCSSKGNLNFNCLLALAPDEVLDCVVVHELCHRKEMNHSNKFYSHVLSVCPNYFSQHKWLKENGQRLLKLIDNK